MLVCTTLSDFLAHTNAVRAFLLLGVSRYGSLDLDAALLRCRSTQLPTWLVYVRKICPLNCHKYGPLPCPISSMPPESNELDMKPQYEHWQQSKIGRHIGPNVNCRSVECHACKTRFHTQLKWFMGMGPNVEIKLYN